MVVSSNNGEKLISIKKTKRNLRESKAVINNSNYFLLIIVHCINLNIWFSNNNF